MTTSDSWNAAAEVASRPLAPWAGLVWRAHNPRYQALDPGGARKWSGRYNIGAQDQSGLQTISGEVPDRWSALYLALDEAGCIVEIIRHTTPERLASLNHSLTEIKVSLSRVLDCSDPAVVGRTMAHLCAPLDYRYTHALALAAINRGTEAMLVPAATGMDKTNLIVFPDHLDPSSSLAIVRQVFPEWRLL